jgi:hypothetical protein
MKNRLRGTQIIVERILRRKMPAVFLPAKAAAQAAKA